MIQNNFSLNLLKKYYLGILIPILLTPLYPHIIHGDYEFYGLVYNNHEFIFDNIFFMNDMTTGFVCEYLFGILIVISSKFISYQTLNFFLDVFMFLSIIALMKKYIKNEIAIFFILVSSSYFFTTALSSIRSELFIAFFVLSYLNKNRSNNFYICYLLAFLTHGSLSFVFYFFFFILFFNELQILKKITILKILLLIFPVIISGPLIFSKAIGYADQNMKDAEIIYSNETILKQLLERKKVLEKAIEFEKSEIKISLKNKNIPKYEHSLKKLTLLELEYEQVLNNIKKIKNKDISALSKINNKLSLSSIKEKINEFVKIKFKIFSLEFANENLLTKKSLLLPKININYKIEFFYLLVIIIFHCFMFIFKKRDLSLYIHLIFTISIFGLIGTTKAGLILFVLTFLIIVKNYHLLKNNLIHKMIIYIFLFPFLLKNISTINKVIFHGNIF